VLNLRNPLLLERARARIENFNRQQLLLEDLFAHCDDRHIEIVWQPMRRAHGCSFYEQDEPFICINPLVSPAEQIIAGWHEYLHLVEHVPDVVTFSTGTFFNLSKMEYQAQVIGVMALMPDPLVRWLNEEEIMGEFGVTQSIARFRLSLFR
jgi:Zn-dependent peptidase ImmA (M78 family)